VKQTKHQFMVWLLPLLLGQWMCGSPNRDHEASEAKDSSALKDSSTLGEALAKDTIVDPIYPYLFLDSTINDKRYVFQFEQDSMLHIEYHHAGKILSSTIDLGPLIYLDINMTKGFRHSNSFVVVENGEIILNNTLCLLSDSTFCFPLFDDLGRFTLLLMKITPESIAYLYPEFPLFGYSFSGETYGSILYHKKQNRFAVPYSDTFSVFQLKKNKIVKLKTVDTSKLPMEYFRTDEEAKVVFGYIAKKAFGKL